MAELSGNLIVRGESVQTLYNNYVSDAFVVNRRYQRKLVWLTSEKASFIDSLLKQLPVPLILTAERNNGERQFLEIIDGLQRLNSIFAFIENQYPIEGKFFDLETLAETKLRLDLGSLEQKKPMLDRRDCVRIANYVLPVSTYRASSEDIVEKYFVGLILMAGSCPGKKLGKLGQYLTSQT